MAGKKSKLNGWTGTILRVNLTTKEISEVPTSNYASKYIGGVALGARIYWEEVSPECAAFDPENKLIFVATLAAGTLSPGGGRTSICTKSPTNMPESYHNSQPGGHFGAELKFSGIDGLIVEGKSDTPVYILVQDGAAEILSAERLWGMTTRETDEELRKQWGQGIKTATIGPAGENLVRYSTIVLDPNRVTGTGGYGSVMGSKNLKAIAVQGTGGVSIARPEELLDVYYNECYKEMPSSKSSPLVNYKTGYIHDYKYAEGVTEGMPQDPENIDAYFDDLGPRSDYVGFMDEVKKGEAEYKFAGCFTCPGPCQFAIKYKDMDVPMTPTSWCSELTNLDPISAPATGKTNTRMNFKWAGLVNDLGLPVSLAGNWNYMLMDCVKAGLITNETAGLPVDSLEGLASDEFVVGAPYAAAYQKNELWKHIGDGVERFLYDLSQESEEGEKIYQDLVHKQYYMSGRGHDQKGGPNKPIFMLCSATGFRDAQHTLDQHMTTNGSFIKGFIPQAEVNKAVVDAQKYWSMELWGRDDLYDEKGKETQTFEGKVEPAIFCQHQQLEGDSIGYCGWGGFPRTVSWVREDRIGDPGIGHQLYTAITGEERSFKESVEAFEPAWNVMKAIHVREGRRREHDVVCDRDFEKNAPWMTKEAYDAALDEYYEARGWDKDTSIPTRTRLVSLGLEDVADDLAKKYGIDVPE